MARKTRLVQKRDVPEPEPLRELHPHPSVWQAALERAGGDPKRLRTIADPDSADGVTVLVLPERSKPEAGGGTGF